MGRLPVGPVRGIAAALVLLLCLPGCFIAKLFGKNPDAPQDVTVRVTCPPAANEGRPFYLLLRTVDTKSWLSDTYDALAAKVMTPDATVLQTVVLFPGGDNLPVRVSVPAKTSVGISFLFTTPTGSWQTRFDPPVPETIDIALQNSAIRTVNPPSAAR